jgi:hypothetical protein
MAHTDWGENGHATPSGNVGAWAGEAILEAPSWKVRQQQHGSISYYLNVSINHHPSNETYCELHNN